MLHLGWAFRRLRTGADRRKGGNKSIRTPEALLGYSKMFQIRNLYTGFVLGRAGFFAPCLRGAALCRFVQQPRTGVGPVRGQGVPREGVWALACRTIRHIQAKDLISTGESEERPTTLHRPCTKRSANNRSRRRSGGPDPTPTADSDAGDGGWWSGWTRTSHWSYPRVRSPEAMCSGGSSP
jgi:hypothetical protein